MAEITHPLRGFVIPDPGFTHSAYISSQLHSEGGAQPGVGVPGTEPTEVRLVASGTQTADVDVEIMTAGYPSQNDGPGVRVKLDSEASTEWRTWNAPAMLQFVTALSSAIAAAAAVIAPDTTALPWLSSIGVAHYGQFYRHVASTGTWVAVEVDSGVAAADIKACSVTALPGDRLLYLMETLVSSVVENRWYRSEDDGASWSLVGINLFPTTYGSSSFTHLEYHAPTASLICIQSQRQWASATGGATWVAVESTQLDVSIAIAANGTIHGIYEDGSNLNVCQISTPFESLADADADARVGGTGTIKRHIWTDADGAVYIYYDNIGGGGTYPTTISMEVTYNDGDSWANVAQPAHAQLDWGTYATVAAPRAVNGRTIVVATPATADSDGDLPLLAFFFGGWSNIEEGKDDDGYWLGGWDHWHAPRDFDSTTQPGTWSGGGYTITTSSGTEVFPASAGFRRSWSGATQDKVECIIDLEALSGGAASTMAIGGYIRCTDGTDSYEVRLHITPTGCQLYDPDAAANVGTAMVFADRVQIRVQLTDEGAVTSQFRSADSPDDLWTEGSSGTCTANAGDTTHGYELGHVTSGTGVSTWYSIVMNERTAAAGTMSTNTVADFKGKPLNTYPYPVPAISTGFPEFHIRMLSGPGWAGETFDVDRIFEYPASNFFATDSPSYAQQWRTLAGYTGEAKFAVDFTTARILGKSPALAFIQTNIQTAKLEGQIAGGGWVDLGTYDPSFTFAYSRTSGSMELRPDTGTPSTGRRYIRENELAGAWVDLGSSKFREISSNTAGSVNGSASQRVIIRLDGVDNSEPTSGTATVWPHSGVMIIRNATVAEYDEWRVRVIAGDSPDDLWRVGACVVGYFQPIGLQPSAGWSHRSATNVQTTRDTRGVIRKRQRGPNRKIWTWSYQDPSDETNLVDADDPDWANNAGPDDFLVTYQDVSTLLFGVLDRLKGGELPCLVVTADVTATTTITDPESFLYGLLDVTSIQSNNVQGDEGVDTVSRIESLTVEEIVG